MAPRHCKGVQRPIDHSGATKALVQRPLSFYLDTPGLGQEIDVLRFCNAGTILSTPTGVTVGSPGNDWKAFSTGSGVATL